MSGISSSNEARQVIEEVPFLSMEIRATGVAPVINALCSSQLSALPLGILVIRLAPQAVYMPSSATGTPPVGAD